MYFNFRLFYKALHLSLIKSPFRLRRWVFVVFFVALFWGMWLIVALGRCLDHVFYRGFLTQVVREPVFIIAPPRSGTTFMQKLMALDEATFVHAKLFQTIFPAVIYQRMFAALARLDSCCGSPASRLIQLAEKKWFGGWDQMHKLRFSEPEEDDGFFVYTFVTEAIYLLFPFVDDLWEAGFADALPAEERRKLMRYYRGCLQRQLFANGPDKTILSKATQSSGALRCLLEEFPDAKFLTIVRHPYQSVASHVSVFYPAWRAHSPEIRKDSVESKAYGRLALKWYRHIYESRTAFDPGRFYRALYSELVEDPVATVTKVYAAFGLPMSATFREHLEKAARENDHYKSAHHYTLEEFGLSPGWVQDELGELLDAYGLER